MDKSQPSVRTRTHTPVDGHVSCAEDEASFPGQQPVTSPGTEKRVPPSLTVKERRVIGPDLHLKAPLYTEKCVGTYLSFLPRAEESEAAGGRTTGWRQDCQGGGGAPKERDMRRSDAQELTLSCTETVGMHSVPVEALREDRSPVMERSEPVCDRSASTMGSSHVLDKRLGPSAAGEDLADAQSNSVRREDMRERRTKIHLAGDDQGTYLRTAGAGVTERILHKEEEAEDTKRRRFEKKPDDAFGACLADPAKRSKQTGISQECIPLPSMILPVFELTEESDGQRQVDVFSADVFSFQDDAKHGAKTANEDAELRVGRKASTGPKEIERERKLVTTTSGPRQKTEDQQEGRPGDLSLANKCAQAISPVAAGEREHVQQILGQLEPKNSVFVEKGEGRTEALVDPMVVARGTEAGLPGDSGVTTPRTAACSETMQQHTQKATVSPAENTVESVQGQLTKETTNLLVDVRRDPTRFGPSGCSDKKDQHLSEASDRQESAEGSSLQTGVKTGHDLSPAGPAVSTSDLLTSLSERRLSRSDSGMLQEETSLSRGRTTERTEEKIKELSAPSSRAPLRRALNLPLNPDNSSSPRDKALLQHLRELETRLEEFLSVFAAAVPWSLYAPASKTGKASEGSPSSPNEGWRSAAQSSSSGAYRLPTFSKCCNSSPLVAVEETTILQNSPAQVPASSPETREQQNLPTTDLGADRSPSCYQGAAIRVSSKKEERQEGLCLDTRPTIGVAFGNRSPLFQRSGSGESPCRSDCPRPCSSCLPSSPHFTSMAAHLHRDERSGLTSTGTLELGEQDTREDSKGRQREYVDKQVKSPCWGHRTSWTAGCNGDQRILLQERDGQQVHSSGGSGSPHNFLTGGEKRPQQRSTKPAGNPPSCMETTARGSSDDTCSSADADCPCPASSDMGSSSSPQSDEGASPQSLVRVRERMPNSTADRQAVLGQHDLGASPGSVTLSEVHLHESGKERAAHQKELSVSPSVSGGHRDRLPATPSSLVMQKTSDSMGRKFLTQMSSGGSATDWSTTPSTTTATPETTATPVTTAAAAIPQSPWTPFSRVSRGSQRWDSSDEGRHETPKTGTMSPHPCWTDPSCRKDSDCGFPREDSSPLQTPDMQRCSCSKQNDGGELERYDTTDTVTIDLFKTMTSPFCKQGDPGSFSLSPPSQGFVIYPEKEGIGNERYTSEVDRNHLWKRPDRTGGQQCCCSRPVSVEHKGVTRLVSCCLRRSSCCSSSGGAHYYKSPWKARSRTESPGTRTHGCCCTLSQSEKCMDVERAPARENVRRQAQERLHRPSRLDPSLRFSASLSPVSVGTISEAVGCEQREMRRIAGSPEDSLLSSGRKLHSPSTTVTEVCEKERRVERIKYIEANIITPRSDEKKGTTESEGEHVAGRLLSHLLLLLRCLDEVKGLKHASDKRRNFLEKKTTTDSSSREDGTEVSGRQPAGLLLDSSSRDKSTPQDPLERVVRLAKQSAHAAAAAAALAHGGERDIADLSTINSNVVSLLYRLLQTTFFPSVALSSPPSGRLLISALAVAQAAAETVSACGTSSSLSGSEHPDSGCKPCAYTPSQILMTREDKMLCMSRPLLPRIRRAHSAGESGSRRKSEKNRPVRNEKKGVWARPAGLCGHESFAGKEPAWTSEFPEKESRDRSLLPQLSSASSKSFFCGRLAQRQLRYHHYCADDQVKPPCEQKREATETQKKVTVKEKPEKNLLHKQRQLALSLLQGSWVIRLTSTVPEVENHSAPPNCCTTPKSTATSFWLSMAGMKGEKKSPGTRARAGTGSSRDVRLGSGQTDCTNCSIGGSESPPSLQTLDHSLQQVRCFFFVSPEFSHLCCSDIPPPSVFSEEEQDQDDIFCFVEDERLCRSSPQRSEVPLSEGRRSNKRKSRETRRRQSAQSLSQQKQWRSLSDSGALRFDLCTSRSSCKGKREEKQFCGETGQLRSRHVNPGGTASIKKNVVSSSDQESPSTALRRKIRPRERQMVNTEKRGKGNSEHCPTKDCFPGLQVDILSPSRRVQSGTPASGGVVDVLTRDGRGQFFSSSLALEADSDNCSSPAVPRRHRSRSPSVSLPLRRSSSVTARSDAPSRRALQSVKLHEFSPNTQFLPGKEKENSLQEIAERRQHSETISGPRSKEESSSCKPRESVLKEATVPQKFGGKIGESGSSPGPFAPRVVGPKILGTSPRIPGRYEDSSILGYCCLSDSSAGSSWTSRSSESLLMAPVVASPQCAWSEKRRSHDALIEQGKKGQRVGGCGLLLPSVDTTAGESAASTVIENRIPKGNGGEASVWTERLEAQTSRLIFGDRQQLKDNCPEDKQRIALKHGAGDSLSLSCADDGDLGNTGRVIRDSVRECSFSDEEDGGTLSNASDSSSVQYPLCMAFPSWRARFWRRRKKKTHRSRSSGETSFSAATARRDRGLDNSTLSSWAGGEPFFGQGTQDSVESVNGWSESVEDDDAGRGGETERCTNNPRKHDGNLEGSFSASEVDLTDYLKNANHPSFLNKDHTRNRRRGPDNRREDRLPAFSVPSGKELGPGTTRARGGKLFDNEDKSMASTFTTAGYEASLSIRLAESSQRCPGIASDSCEGPNSLSGRAMEARSRCLDKQQVGAKRVDYHKRGEVLTASTWLNEPSRRTGETTSKKGKAGVDDTDKNILRVPLNEVQSLDYGYCSSAYRRLQASQSSPLLAIPAYLCCSIRLKRPLGKCQGGADGEPELSRGVGKGDMTHGSGKRPLLSSNSLESFIKTSYVKGPKTTKTGADTSGETTLDFILTSEEDANKWIVGLNGLIPHNPGRVLFTTEEFSRQLRVMKAHHLQRLKMENLVAHARLLSTPVPASGNLRSSYLPCHREGYCALGLASPVLPLCDSTERVARGASAHQVALELVTAALLLSLRGGNSRGALEPSDRYGQYTRGRRPQHSHVKGLSPRCFCGQYELCHLGDLEDSTSASSGGSPDLCRGLEKRRKGSRGDACASSFLPCGSSDGCRSTTVASSAEENSLAHGHREFENALFPDFCPSTPQRPVITRERSREGVTSCVDRVATPPSRWRMRHTGTEGSDERTVSRVLRCRRDTGEGGRRRILSCPSLHFARHALFPCPHHLMEDRENRCERCNQTPVGHGPTPHVPGRFQLISDSGPSPANGQLPFIQEARNHTNNRPACRACSDYSRDCSGLFYREVLPQLDARQTAHVDRRGRRDNVSSDLRAAMALLLRVLDTTGLPPALSLTRCERHCQYGTPKEDDDNNTEGAQCTGENNPCDPDNESVKSVSSPHVCVEHSFPRQEKSKVAPGSRRSDMCSLRHSAEALASTPSSSGAPPLPSFHPTESSHKKAPGMAAGFSGSPRSCRAVFEARTGRSGGGSVVTADSPASCDFIGSIGEAGTTKSREPATMKAASPACSRGTSVDAFQRTPAVSSLHFGDGNAKAQSVSNAKSGATGCPPDRASSLPFIDLLPSNGARPSTAGKGICTGVSGPGCGPVLCLHSGMHFGYPVSQQCISRYSAAGRVDTHYTHATGFDTTPCYLGASPTVNTMQPLHAVLPCRTFWNTPWSEKEERKLSAVCSSGSETSSERRSISAGIGRGQLLSEGPPGAGSSWKTSLTQEAALAHDAGVPSCDSNKAQKGHDTENHHRRKNLIFSALFPAGWQRGRLGVDRSEDELPAGPGVGSGGDLHVVKAERSPAIAGKRKGATARGFSFFSLAKRKTRGEREETEEKPLQRSASCFALETPRLPFLLRPVCVTSPAGSPHPWSNVSPCTYPARAACTVITNSQMNGHPTWGGCSPSGGDWLSDSSPDSSGALASQRAGQANGQCCPTGENAHTTGNGRCFTPHGFCLVDTQPNANTGLSSFRGWATPPSTSDCAFLSPGTVWGTWCGSGAHSIAGGARGFPGHHCVNAGSAEQPCGTPGRTLCGRFLIPRPVLPTNQPVDPTRPRERASVPYGGVVTSPALPSLREQCGEVKGDSEQEKDTKEYFSSQTGVEATNEKSEAPGALQQVNPMSLGNVGEAQETHWGEHPLGLSKLEVPNTLGGSTGISSAVVTPTMEEEEEEADDEEEEVQFCIFSDEEGSAGNENQATETEGEAQESETAADHVPLDDAGEK